MMQIMRVFVGADAKRVERESNDKNHVRDETILYLCSRQQICLYVV